MEKNRIDKTTSQIAVVLQEGPAILLLSFVWATDSMLPLAETIGQWIWFDKAAIAACVCICILCLFK